MTEGACRCPETWLIDYAHESGGAWDRRVLGLPVNGDCHIGIDTLLVHVYDGTTWGVLP